MDEQWINDLRKKQAEYTEPAPQGLWDDIEAAMKKMENTVPDSPAKKVPLRPIALWTAAAAILIAAIFLVDNNKSPLQTDTPDTNCHVVWQKKKNDKPIMGVIQAEDRIVKPICLRNKHYNKTDETNDTITKIITLNDSLNSSFIAATTENNKTKKVDSENAATNRKKEQRIINRNNLHTNELNKNMLVYNNIDFSKKKSRGLTIDIYSSNLSEAKNISNGYGELVLGSILPNETTDYEFNPQINTLHEIMLANQEKDIYTNIRHKQPINVGISLRYRLNDKFGIESGLTYSYLSSELTAGSENNRYETKQTLQYIGIPLNINYCLWENKRWYFYASAGGKVDKCISGKSDTDYILNGKVTSSDEENVRVKPLQFSVNASAGMQVKVTSLLGVFAEPGISYYFDNGSSIETIYKEKPLNFNIKLGLRFSLK